MTQKRYDNLERSRMSVIDFPQGPRRRITAEVTNVLAGEGFTINFTVTPGTKHMTLWNMAVSVFVDQYELEYQWPSGSSLDSNTRKMALYTWIDWELSDDRVNEKVFRARVVNFDSVAHDIFVDIKVYTDGSVPGSTSF